MIVKSKQTGELHKAVWVWGHWYCVYYDGESAIFDLNDFEVKFEFVSETGESLSGRQMVRPYGNERFLR